jgi:alpha-beta hydrolase superfamily lysophospholipase
LTIPSGRAYLQSGPERSRRWARGRYFVRAWRWRFPFYLYHSPRPKMWSLPRSRGGAPLLLPGILHRPEGPGPFPAVAFYPVCYPVYDPDTPLLVLTGRKDDVCSAAAAEGLKRKYREQNWKTELSFEIYPNAYHSFDMEGVSLGSFGHHYQHNPRAVADAIIRTRAFLNKHLGRP